MWTNGSRRGAPVILVVDAAAMAERGHLFYRSENGLADRARAGLGDRLPRLSE